MAENRDFPTTRFLGSDGDEVVIEQLPYDDYVYDAMVAINDSGQFVGWWSNRIFDPATQTWGPEPKREDKRWGWWADRQTAAPAAVTGHQR